MSAAPQVSGVAAVVGGLLASPLLVGLIQHWKARLQGRRGPTPLQPYRELRRLWGKSGVEIEGTSMVYRLAPAVVGAAMVAAIAVVPVTSAGPNLGFGHDLVLLVALLALSRFASAAGAWDVANGFSLMGASRDLTVSVMGEVVLLLGLAVPAVITGSSDLAAMVAGTAGGTVWSSPALPLGGATFALVAMAELGRQPFDNPDTHLELTMIHEGPLLEYAGRDLAYLQWASASRHWVLLVLGVELFIPHPADAWLQLGLLPIELVAACAALAVIETLVAKMRVLLAPRLLAVAAVAAVLGIAVQGTATR